MSQGVTKLKELLFEPESKALADLEKRLDAVFARTGTEERFRNSVAGVLDGALREAEVVKHSALSDAIAPLVVRTIKTEITNSQDELVEALYPMTGRMVKAYVASAMKDLANQINARLERNPLMLRLNSLMTGRSVAELAMADAQALEVEELYLIRRGSGELLARWPENTSSANRDQVMSGILTAINEFATEAFQSDGAALRQIDLGDTQVYLRGSPTYLLAAKCSGAANASIEQIIDDEFLSAIEAFNNTPDAISDNSKTIGAAHSATMKKLSAGLTDRVATQYAQQTSQSSGTSPAKLLAWIIGLALVAWLSWWLYDSYTNGRTHALAAHVITASPEMEGYPTHLTVTDYGSKLTLSGLAPSPHTHSDVIARLRTTLPAVDIRDKLTVVNSNARDYRPEISGLNTDLARLRTKLTGVEGGVSDLNSYLTGVKAGVSGVKADVGTLESGIGTLRAQMTREAIVRATSRALSRLAEITPDLTRLAANLDDKTALDRVTKTRATLDTILPAISQHHTTASNPKITDKELADLGPKLEGLTHNLAEASNDIALALAIANARRTGNPVTDPEPATTFSLDTAGLGINETAEQLALQAERFATLTVAASQASTIKLVTPSARAQLEAWTRANAIFFTRDTEFANTRTTLGKLDELAGLAKSAKVLVRVIGFTDEKGADTRNSTLSIERARKIRRLLISRGVNARFLVAVGRQDTQDLSTVIGERSPNRRVQFEVGFLGERER